MARHFSRLISKATRETSGFTLTEVAIVCSIIGVIGLIAAPSVRNFNRGAETRSSAAQIAGVLKDARARAISEATPQLVFVNEPTKNDDGTCGAVAVVVGDADRNYEISAGDRVNEISLAPAACDKVKLYAQDDTANPFVGLKLPVEDFTARAPSASDKTEKGKSKGKGKGKGGEQEEEEKGKEKKGKSESTGLRVETVAETVLFGATFPTDDLSGRPVIAFSERGIAVNPLTPDEPGSGAGGVYLTDGIEVVYAAVVQPLGNVQLRKYEPTRNEWR